MRRNSTIKKTERTSHDVTLSEPIKSIRNYEFVAKLSKNFQNFKFLVNFSVLNKKRFTLIKYHLCKDTHIIRYMQIYEFIYCDFCHKFSNFNYEYLHICDFLRIFAYKRSYY